ncbi:hypothetical protein GEV33_004817 [Tenebrio molitor]|uniref:DUF4371 domain-containing protein n=1 Tax=Tenebrio molitor TaxID=7067 RepID=A0A8J6LD39_TENMO|nr:hypothetical protein GEV33_004817 [Tenebrio molitor]
MDQWLLCIASLELLHVHLIRDERSGGSLINLTAELDEALKDHIEKATVFKGTSKTIQNELLDCMLDVLQDTIKKEILEADFVSAMADETSDVSSIFQMAVVFRYVLPDGTPVERFWAFLNPGGHDAVSLAATINEVLRKIKFSEDPTADESRLGRRGTGERRQREKGAFEVWFLAGEVTCFYLRHHGVTKPDSPTTKLRIVFDVSCKSHNHNLNDMLSVGPKLQEDLFHILLRFRKHAIAFSADIEKMYFQVEVHPEHRDFQRGGRPTKNFLHPDIDPTGRISEWPNKISVLTKYWGDHPLIPAITAFETLTPAAEMGEAVIHRRCEILKPFWRGSDLLIRRHQVRSG